MPLPTKSTLQWVIKFFRSGLGRGRILQLRFWASLLCSNHQATYVSGVSPMLLPWALPCWSWNSESSFSFASSCETPPVGGTKNKGGQENGLALPFCFQFCEHPRSSAFHPAAAVDASPKWCQHRQKQPHLALRDTSTSQQHPPKIRVPAPGDLARSP